MVIVFLPSDIFRVSSDAVRVEVLLAAQLVKGTKSGMKTYRREEGTIFVDK